MVLFLALESITIFLVFSDNAHSPRTRYVIVADAPTAKTAVQVPPIPRSRPTYAAVNKPLISVANRAVCNRMPGAVKTVMKLGSRKWKCVFSLRTVNSLADPYLKQPA